MRFVRAKGGGGISGGDSAEGDGQFHQDTLVVSLAKTAIYTVLCM